MSEPKRYTQNIKCVEPSYLAQNIQSGMVECSIGEWVLHSDYARLKEEVKRLTEDNRQLNKAFEIAEAIIKRMGNAAENAAKEGKPSV